jgi:hypothetical protein
MRQPRIKAEHLRALMEGQAVTGRSAQSLLQSLLDEAMEQFITCNLATLLKGVAERCASA